HIAALKALKELRAEVLNFFNEFYRNERTSEVATDSKEMTFNRATEIYKHLEQLAYSVNMKPSNSLFSSVITSVFNNVTPFDYGPAVGEEDFLVCSGFENASQIFASYYIDCISAMDYYRINRYFAPPLKHLETPEQDSAKLMAMFDELKSSKGLLQRNIKVTSVVRIPFREIVVEAKIGAVQDEHFVPQMKLNLVFLNAELAVVRIGAPKETLWSEENDCHSKYEVFKKMSRSAAHCLLGKYNLKKIPNLSVFISILSFVQLFTTCFTSPCHVCQKSMRDFLPPVLLKEYRPVPIFVHEDCGYS
ncbi:hypothetical protein OSTOST_07337, partial [Ostertagia ostertagi]